MKRNGKIKKLLSAVIGLTVAMSSFTYAFALDEAFTGYSSDWEDFVKYNYNYDSSSFGLFDGASVSWAVDEAHHGTVRKVSGGFSQEVAKFSENGVSTGKIVISSQMKFIVPDKDNMKLESVRVYLDNDISPQTSPYALGDSAPARMLESEMWDGVNESNPDNQLAKTTMFDYWWTAEYRSGKGIAEPDEWSQFDVVLDYDNMKESLLVNGQTLMNNITIPEKYSGKNSVGILAHSANNTIEFDNFKVYDANRVKFQAEKAYAANNVIQMSTAVGSVPENGVKLIDLTTGIESDVTLISFEGSYIKVNGADLKSNTPYAIKCADDTAIVDILGNELSAVNFKTQNEVVLTNNDFSNGFGVNDSENQPIKDAVNLPMYSEGWTISDFGGDTPVQGTVTSTEDGCLKYDSSVSGFKVGTAVFYTFPAMPKNYDMHISFDGKSSVVGNDGDPLFLGISFANPRHMVNKKSHLVSMNTIRDYRVGADQMSDICYWYGGFDTAATLVDSANYSANEWYRFFVDLSVRDNHSVSARYRVEKPDGTVIGQTNYIKVTGIGDGLNTPEQIPTGLYFKMESNGTKRSQSYIDNFKVSYTEDTDISSVSVIGLDNSKASLNAKVSNTVKGFEFDFNTEPSSMPTVTISDGENTVSNTVSKNGSKYTAELTGMMFPDKDYTMTVSYSVAQNNTAADTLSDINTQKSAVYGFRTEKNDNIIVSDFGFWSGDTKIENFADISTGTEIKLKANLYNYTGDKKSACLMYGIFSDNYMKAIDYAQNTDIESGFNPVTIEKAFTVTADMKADVIRGFIWENLTSYKPYTQSVDLIKTNN